MPTAQTSILWYENFNGIALFAVTDPASGVQLWRSDATTAGTSNIGAIPTEPTQTSRLQGNTTAPAPWARHRLTVGQSFFFAGVNAETGAELYALTNDAPVAGNDHASSSNDAAVPVNVLANDSDPDGTLDATSVQVVSQPAHGTATASSNGTINYTPTPGFSGTDSFMYTVRDNQGASSNAATVTVDVTAPPASQVTVTGSRGGAGALRGGALLGLLSIQLLRMLRRHRRQPTPNSVAALATRL
jgi:ELWxxDGT repeat protein